MLLKRKTEIEKETQTSSENTNMKRAVSELPVQIVVDKILKVCENCVENRKCLECRNLLQNLKVLPKSKEEFQNFLQQNSITENDIKKIQNCLLRNLEKHPKLDKILNILEQKCKDKNLLKSVNCPILNDIFSSDERKKVNESLDETIRSEYSLYMLLWVCAFPAWIVSSKDKIFTTSIFALISFIIKLIYSTVNEKSKIKDEYLKIIAKNLDL